MAADRPGLTSTGNVTWAIFDPSFYARHNPAATDIKDPDLLLGHYLQHGATAGFSPNRWFDETFYRATNQDVVALIRAGDVTCGFEHYGQLGYIDRAPHWLFDPEFYRQSNPDLTQEVLEASDFVNSYDHYLKYGAREGRRAHASFDPATYIAQLPADQATACRQLGAFAHFLTRAWDAAEPSVLGFDQAAYRATHPDLPAQIRAGRWHSALHHFLVNTRLPQQREAPAPAPQIKINIDRPALRDGAAVDPITGHLDIVGWAASNHAIASVEIFVDDLLLGRAHHGIRTEGVAAAFPEFVHAQFAGLRFIAATEIAPGPHRVRVLARDATGHEASEAFTAEFKPQPDREGPWSLRRRMRQAEADFKLNLLQNAALAPEFIIVLRDTADSEALARTHACLRRQVYPRWLLPNAVPSGSDVWLIQLTAGDEPGVDALLELALHLLLHPPADFIYSDERRIDPNTGAVAAFFKPDWSPEFLLATNYIGRLWAVRATIAARAGLDLRAFATISAYDAVLRLTEHATHIAHVPKVLCESTPVPFTDLPAEEQVLQAALTRRGLACRVEPGRLPYTWRARPIAPATPLISIIIPTAGTGDLITIALRSLRATTDYPNLEVIVIDTRPGTVAPWKESLDAADRVIEDGGPFNWSRLNNRAAAVARGDVLLFVNDDVEFTDPGWLRALMEPLQHPGVGIVGPQLLFPGGMVQHAGMFLTPTKGMAAFHGLSANAPGPFGLALTARNVSAVTGACLLVPSDVFSALGGFDERLEVIGNDVDLCFRCLESGRRVVFTPHTILTHHESTSRAGLSEHSSERFFLEHWQSRLAAGDPYFNRNLSIAHTDCRPEMEPVEIIYPPRPLARPESIRRILVIKLDGIGDFVLSLPAIRRLKLRFPWAHLTLLAAEDVCRIAPMEPAIQGVIEYNFATDDGPTDEAGLAPLLTSLRRLAFDLAVDLRCHEETRSVLEGCGATWRAGFDRAYASPWLDIVGIAEPDISKSAKRTHMADTLLDFAEKIGAAFTPTWSPPRTPPPQWPANVPAPPPDARLRIAIHPGAGAAIKRWPAEHFASLINMLSTTYPCWVILVGGPDEANLATQIRQHAAPNTPIASAIGHTPLDDLARIIGSCDLFIGNDSGPHHLAAALGIPTIGIHSGVVDAKEWSPLSPSAVAIRRDMFCSPCYLKNADDCPRSGACLTQLSPSRVLTAAQAHLAACRNLRTPSKEIAYSS